MAWKEVEEERQHAQALQDEVERAVGQHDEEEPAVRSAGDDAASEEAQASLKTRKKEEWEADHLGEGWEVGRLEVR